MGNDFIRHVHHALPSLAKVRCMEINILNARGNMRVILRRSVNSVEGGGFRHGTRYPMIIQGDRFAQTQFRSVHECDQIIQ